jgi:hypothetical protein
MNELYTPNRMSIRYTLIVSSYLRLDISPLDFPHAFFFPSVHATFLAQLILLDFIIL